MNHISISVHLCTYLISYMVDLSYFCLDSFILLVLCGTLLLFYFDFKTLCLEYLYINKCFFSILSHTEVFAFRVGNAVAFAADHRLAVTAAGLVQWAAQDSTHSNEPRA